MATIASLNVLLTAQTGPLGKGLTQAAGMVQGFAGRMKGIGGAVGAVMTSSLSEIAVLIAAVGTIGESLHRAAEAQESVGKLNAVLQATGNTTGFAQSQLLELADSLEKTTNYSHVATEGAIAMLASFHNISGTSFEAALKASQDMSAVLGTDLRENTMRLGRALENPLQGMKLLNREGIGFTVIQEQQIQAMVAAGNVAGAQGLILSGLQSKFAGAAAGMASPFVQLKNEVASLSEKIGATMLPAVVRGVHAIAPVLELVGGYFVNMMSFCSFVTEKAFNFIGSVFRGIVAFVRPIWNGFTTFIGAAVSKILDFIAPVLLSLT